LTISTDVARGLLTLCVLLLFTVIAVQAQEYRPEKDLLGEKQIPADAYYGIQTARALENLRISGETPQDYPELIIAFAIVKLTAAMANHESGALPMEVLNAIEKACEAILSGRYHDQFVVDLYQGGAGTSANMIANEVIANAALELSGHEKDDYHTI